MIEISQIATRVDSLLQNEQDNRMFVTETLRKNALEILDEKFESKLRTRKEDIGLLALRSGIFLIGVGLTHAKKPNGQKVQDNVIKEMNSDKKEKSLKKIIWGNAREQIVKLNADQLYQLIFLLKNTELKTVLEFLKIDPNIV